MTDRSDLTEPGLEGRLRTLLSDRAATIDGPPPALPAAPSPGDAPAALASGDGARRTRRAVLVGAMTAAAVVLVAALVVATGGGRNGPEPRDQVVATQPEVEATSEASPRQAVFRANGEHDPLVVAETYLRTRLGDGTDARDAELRDQLRLDVGEPVERRGRAGIVPITWHLAGSSGSDQPASTVYVQDGRTGSDVLEAAVEGIDLDDVAYERDRVTGTIGLPSVDGYGSSAVATLSRRGGGPLLEPDVPAVVGEGDAWRTTLPKGEPFDLEVTESGDLSLAVTVLGASSPVPVAIAEIGLVVPPDPEAESLVDRTPEEQLALIPRSSDSPACKETGAWQMPDPVPFPDQVVPRTARPAEPVRATGSTPEAAMEALATQLDVTWETLFTPADLRSGYGLARLPGGRMVDLELYRDEPEGPWRVVTARTRGACRDFGGSNLAAPGAPNPTSRLGVPVTKGAVDGVLRYDIGDESVEVTVADSDVDGHMIAVPGEATAIAQQALVLRDDDGDPVLVDLTAAP